MTSSMEEILRGFSIVIDLPVQWGEMDAFGHVNNVVYFRYFESARIAYFDAVGFTDNAGVGPILHSTQCRFRRPLTYPDTLKVGARAKDLQGDRFTLDYVVVSQRLQLAAAEGTSVVVAFDYRAQQKAPLPSSVTAAMARLDPSVTS